MTDNMYQNDFFGAEHEERKRLKMGALSDYAKQRYLPYLKIPIEYTVIIAIGIMVFVIVAYAVGVKVGRSGRDAQTRTETGSVPVKIEYAEMSSDDPAVEATAKPGVVGTSAGTGAYSYEVPGADVSGFDPYEGARNDYVGAPPGEGIPEVEETPVPTEKPAPTVPDSVYVVQLAAFSDEAKASEAAKVLGGKGVEAHVSHKGSWYQVYASGYNTIETARKARTKFQEMYPDCYIRKVK